jgi:septum formation protein
LDNLLSVRLTLVSASPRRRELLERLGLPFDVLPSNAAERWAAADARELAQVNARRKVEKSVHYRALDRLLLGADTIIAFDGRVFGKPAGRESAGRMLRTLSGRWHEVVTGVCLSGPAVSGVEPVTIASSVLSRVRFRALSSFEIEAYLDAGEWHGKAGAYAIQDAGGALVETLDGGRENVIGLPTELIHELLARHFRHCRFL